VSSTDTISGVLNARDASAEMISQICLDLVQMWTSGMSTDDMYRSLLENAKSPADVDTMLYQLEGDPVYAENAALIVLAAAWSYPELASEIKQLALYATDETQPDQRGLALSVMFGMYLMARAGAEVDKVTYRNPQGQIETVAIDHSISTARLFDAVREQYGVSI
jgi:hypothetical protein